MLTQLLREREDVARLLSSLVTYTPSAGALPLQAHPQTKNYALVGTAFDYLLRWELERRNPAAKDREWVATIAVEKILPLLPPVMIDEPTRALYQAVHREALAVHAELLSTAGPSLPVPLLTRAARAVLCLAKIDPLYRTGTVNRDIDPSHRKEGVNVFEPKDVEDVMCLYSITDWEVIGGTAGKPVLLNPEFGTLSERLNGADADLVVGTTLVDLKTSKYDEIEKHFPQLVGYFILGQLYREEDPSYPVVDRAGIYWCRHGYLDTFETGPILDHPEYEAAVEALLGAADDLRIRQQGHRSKIPGLEGVVVW